jgi:hypothetical protein
MSRPAVDQTTICEFCGLPIDEVESGAHRWLGERVRHDGTSSRCGAREGWHRDQDDDSGGGGSDGVFVADNDFDVVAREETLADQ